MIGTTTVCGNHYLMTHFEIWDTDSINLLFCTRDTAHLNEFVESCRQQWAGSPLTCGWMKELAVVESNDAGPLEARWLLTDEVYYVKETN